MKHKASTARLFVSAHVGIALPKENQLQEVLLGERSVVALMQQRYYDPQIGRFLSVDPVTAYENPIGAFNRYWYANNNPYKFTDPDGRQVVIGKTPNIRQEQMVPPAETQKMQAAQNAAAPKTIYASVSLASAKGGGPAISGSVEVGKATGSVGLGGADLKMSPGSARIDTMAGSADTSGESTSGMTVGTAASGPSGTIGVSSSMSSEVISNIPMTKLTIGPITVEWGVNSKGDWAMGGSASMKASPKLISLERPKADE